METKDCEYEELQEGSSDTSENNEDVIESEHIYLQDSNELTAENINENKKEIKERTNDESIDSTKKEHNKNQKRKIIHSAEKHPEEQIRKRNHLYNFNDDPDLIFFKSLLPDLHRMNNKQKIRLKLAVLREVHDILYPDDSDSDPLLNTS